MKLNSLIAVSFLMASSGLVCQAAGWPGTIFIQPNGPRLIADSAGDNPASNSAVPSAKQVLVPVGDGGPGADTGLATFDFGTISQRRSEPLVHDFVLRNGGAQPVTIDRVQPQCGCTTAVIAGGAAANEQAAGTTVAPGASVTIHVSVDPGHIVPGSARKSVLVYIRDQPDPAATLLMTGTMQALVQFSPTNLSFPNVPAGKSRSAVVTAVYDKSLLDEGPLPTVRFSQNTPGLTIREANKRAAAASTDPNAPPIPMSGDVVERYYRVEVASDAPIGNGACTLVVDPGSRKEPLSAFCSIAYSVVGDIQASPNVIAFGSVAQGSDSQTGHVVIWGKPGTNVKRFKIHADAPDLSVQFMPATGTSSATPPVGADGAAEQELGEVTVMLKAGAPAGEFRSTVTVSTADRQRIVIPVWAYVVTVQK